MKKTVLLLIFITLYVSSFAQTTDDILKLLVDKEMISQADADALKKESEAKKPSNVIQKFKTAFTSEYFKLSGYGQFGFNATDNAQGNPYTLNQNSNFLLHRAILFATGQLGKGFGYMLMYDFGPKSALHELYGEWTPIPEFGARLGQFKVPFTMENPMSPTRWATIYPTRGLCALTGSVGDVIGSKAGRDAGFQLSGKAFAKLKHSSPNATFKDFYRIEYYAGLFNGTGFNTPDNNNHKDFTAAVYLQPIKGLRVGGSMYSGKADYIKAGDSLVIDHVRNRWAASAEYDSKHFYVRTEYIEGNDGGIERCAAYVESKWKIKPDKWEVVAKYDYYNPDKTNTLGEVNEATAGVNYYLAPLSRIQLNYIYTDNKATGIYNTVAMQLQLFF